MVEDKTVIESLIRLQQSYEPIYLRFRNKLKYEILMTCLFDDEQATKHIKFGSNLTCDIKEIGDNLFIDSVLVRNMGSSGRQSIKDFDFKMTAPRDLWTIFGNDEMKRKYPRIHLIIEAAVLKVDKSFMIDLTDIYSDAVLQGKIDNIYGFSDLFFYDPTWKGFGVESFYYDRDKRLISLNGGEYNITTMECFDSLRILQSIRINYGGRTVL